MRFDSLEDKMLYFRSLADYKLMAKTPVLIMLDGRSFSKVIKKRFKRPFDDDFINMMNQTAKYLCENAGNCKFAYIQSDEITLFLSDLDNPNAETFFGYRLCKLQSIIASMAAAKFNQLLSLYEVSHSNGDNDPSAIIGGMKLVEFDCRAWNVPTEYDVMAWFIYRQNDCVRNSKAQSAQTYLPHKTLLGKKVDDQIDILLKEKGINWYDFTNGEKYGRFVYKTQESFYNKEHDISYMRSVWKVSGAWPLQEMEGRKKLYDLGIFAYYKPQEEQSDDKVLNNEDF